MTFTRFAVNSLAAGPTGFHPWVDVLVRVSRLPAVTISLHLGEYVGQLQKAKQ
jgi:hypothetical protein